MKKIRKLFCILLTLVMVVGLLPLGQVAYATDFSPTEIPDVAITSVQSVAAGGTAAWLNEAATVPAGAHYSASYYRLYCLSYGNSWGANDEIIPGYYDLQVVFTPEAGYSFPAPDSIKAAITGIVPESYEIDKFGMENSQIVVHYYFTVGDGVYWEALSYYSIPVSRVGKPIKTFMLSQMWAHGGTAPYTFNKKSGPSWIDVNTNGIVSGTPNAAADATTLVVEVMDKNGKSTTFNISVGKVYSSDTDIAFTTQPTAQTVTAGNTATFKVVATGTGITYQWQWSADGTTWKNCTSTGYNTATFAFTASASLNGRQYRCIVKNSAGSTTSNAAKLTVTSAVTKPTITTQPTDKTVTSGTSVTFKVVATGTSLTYQWQWSADNGKTWKNCTSTGYNTASFSFKASAALNGRMYRCVVKNSAGSATSTGAKLTVSNVKPAITVQPTNMTATAGTKVSFSVVAAGSGLKYQWQWSADGTTWTNCKSTGYNTATFTFTASASLNNRQYRCVVSNSYGSTTSTAGKLTVK